uniref:Saposin B-type domain-containing protein n=1 Tax=Steinernema glaseri TaxID=37863 RepID=A0A1I8AUY8_9BILA
MCSSLIEAVEGALGSGESSIKKIGKEVCDKLFGSDPLKGALCNSVLNGASAGAKDDILNKVKPEDICKKLFFC